MERQNQNPEIETEGVDLEARMLCIAGLAEAVPQFISRERAADMLSTWFPEDRLALQSLHKQITANSPLIAA